mmetsp:Transcript_7048/g.10377  ORF Transcript_7048/g.10377 Transcript_7048/m.10377 type:complete len:584 (+) Transcript_7048:1-1752(+)
MKLNLQPYPKDHYQEIAFVQKSKESDFFLAFGIALLETLNRLRLRKDIYEQVLNRMQRCFSGFPQNLSGSLEVIQRLFSCIDLVEVETSKEWLDHYFTSEENISTQVEDFVIGLILSANPSARDSMNTEVENLNYLLTPVLEAIGINLRVEIHENKPLELFGSPQLAPLVVMFLYGTNYGLIYHSKHKYVDAGSQLENDFPFFSQKPDNSPDVKTFLTLLDNLYECIDLSKIKNLQRTKQLVNEINRSLPVTESVLRKLESSLNKISACGHSSGLFKTDCGDQHCFECLRELIKEQIQEKKSLSEMTCRCNKKISPKNINSIYPEVSKELDKSGAFPQTKSSQLPSYNASQADSKIVPIISSQSQLSGSQQYPPTRQPTNSQSQSPANPMHQRLSLDQPFNSKFPNSNPSQFQVKKLNPQPEKILTECYVCKQGKEEDEFNLVKCSDHSICNECRSRLFAEGSNSCPKCNREYGDNDIDLLRCVAMAFGHEIQERKEKDQFFCEKCRTYKHQKLKFDCKCGKETCKSCSQGSCAFCKTQTNPVKGIRCNACGQNLPREEIFLYPCQHPVHQACVQERCPVCPG